MTDILSFSFTPKFNWIITANRFFQKDVHRLLGTSLSFAGFCWVLLGFGRAERVADLFLDHPEVGVGIVGWPAVFE